MEKIDFVILWVDGNDEKWLKEKSNYIPSLKNKENNNSARFRDWENLKYWFRSIEKNCKYVNKIYFITWGHLPRWLNTSNPKLVVIKHQDYIPSKYLPTYNSNVIELNLFRIKELSENFVLFNDDMFVMESTKATDFFKKGLPCECFSEVINFNTNMNDIYTHNLLNNMCIINKHFNKRKAYLKNFTKFFSLKYSFKENFQTLSLLSFKHFSLIDNKHLPVSLKKSTLKKLWDIEYECLDRCCNNKFRDFTDVSQYLIRYFQLVTGKFYPRASKFGQYFALTNDNAEIIKILNKRKYKIVCFNDTNELTDFEQSKAKLNEYLVKRFPDSSSYERGEIL